MVGLKITLFRIQSTKDKVVRLLRAADEECAICLLQSYYAPVCPAYRQMSNPCFILNPLQLKSGIQGARFP